MQNLFKKQFFQKVLVFIDLVHRYVSSHVSISLVSCDIKFDHSILAFFEKGEECRTYNWNLSTK